MPYYYVTKSEPRSLRKKKSVKIIAILLTISLLLCGLFFYANYHATQIIEQLTSATIRQLINDKINEALDMLVSSYSVDYNQYFTVKYGSDGIVSLISADTVKINKLMSQYSTLIQQRVASVKDDDVSVPALAFSGWALIANLGTPVRLKIEAVGSAPCNYRTEFKEVGINQTLHSIYIDVEAGVDIVLPVNDIRIVEKSSVLVCENVIVGKVPDFYLNGLMR
ncbi:MAG: sporulation protein YunB [Clostridia bacterium]|nr:sporulation protein YunB [Clostridia bacterium]